MKNISFEQVSEWYSCIKRELELRKKFYPVWVAKGKMKKDKADYEIKIMADICEYFRNEYEEMEKEYKKQLDLL